MCNSMFTKMETHLGNICLTACLQKMETHLGSRDMTKLIQCSFRQLSKFCNAIKQHFLALDCYYISEVRI